MHDAEAADFLPKFKPPVDPAAVSRGRPLREHSSPAPAGFYRRGSVLHDGPTGTLTLPELVRALYVLELARERGYARSGGPAAILQLLHNLGATGRAWPTLETVAERLAKTAKRTSCIAWLGDLEHVGLVGRTRRAKPTGKALADGRPARRQTSTCYVLRPLVRSDDEAVSLLLDRQHDRTTRRYDRTLWPLVDGIRPQDPNKNLSNTSKHVQRGWKVEEEDAQGAGGVARPAFRNRTNTRRGRNAATAAERTVAARDEQLARKNALRQRQELAQKPPEAPPPLPLPPPHPEADVEPLTEQEIACLSLAEIGARRLAAIFGRPWRRSD